MSYITVSIANDKYGSLKLYVALSLDVLKRSISIVWRVFEGGGK